MIANFLYTFTTTTLLYNSVKDWTLIYRAPICGFIALSSFEPLLSMFTNKTVKKYKTLITDWMQVFITISMLGSLKYRFDCQIEPVHLLPSLVRATLLTVDYKLIKERLTIEDIEKQLEERQNAKKQE